MNKIAKSIKRNSRCLIIHFRIETGIGSQLIIHILLAETNNNLDILALIVWMLYRWLFIQFGIPIHLNSVHYGMQIWEEIVTLSEQLQDR